MFCGKNIEMIWTSVRHKGWGKFSAVAPLTIQHRQGSIDENGQGQLGGSPPIGGGLGKSPTKFNHLTESNR